MKGCCAHADFVLPQQALEEMIQATRDATATRDAIIAREAAVAAAAAGNSSDTDAADGMQSPSAAAAAAGVAAGAACAGAQPGGLHHASSGIGLVGLGPLAQSAAASPGGNATSGGAAAAAAAGFSLSGLGGSVGAAIAATPGGPLQLTSATAGLVGNIERLIRSTQSSGGQQVRVGRGWAAATTSMHMHLW